MTRRSMLFVSMIVILSAAVPMSAQGLQVEDVGDHLEYLFPEGGLGGGEVLRAASDAMGVPLWFPSRSSKIEPLLVAGRVRVKKSEAPGFWRSILEESGYSPVEFAAGGSRLLRVERRAPSGPPQLVTVAELEALKTREDLKVLLPFKLNHPASSSAYRAMAPLVILDPTAGYQYDPQSDMILVWGTAPHVNFVYRAFLSFDLPARQPARITERLPLRFSRAVDVSSLVTSLLASKPVQNTGAQVTLNCDSLIPDERTNSLIVHGSSDWIELVRAAVKSLDVRVEEIEQPALEVRVYPLANSTAREIQPIVDRSIGGSRHGDVRISADQRTNALVVVGTSDVQAAVRDLIAQLDRRVEEPK